MDMEGSNALEKFYVYRSLHSDESWGAILADSSIQKLPNIAFGMKVFALNEKEAIGKAKRMYDRIHMYDNDKRNVREFAAAIFECFAEHDGDTAADMTLQYAIELNKKFKQHFERLEEENER